MLREPSRVPQLMELAGAKVFRLVIGNTHVPIFPAPEAEFNSEAFYDAVGVYVRAAQPLNAKYILSISSPAKWMKTYNADASHVYLAENTLREEYHGLFVKLVTWMIDELGRRGLQLPYGISLQTCPDGSPLPFGCPPSLPQGCQYNPTHYQTIVAEVREAWHENGMNGLRFVGPETINPHHLAAYDQGKLDDVLLFSAWPSMATLPPDAPFRGESDRRPCWLQATIPADKGSSKNFLNAVFERMSFDLAESRATYWLWPFGYAPDDTGEALFTGPDYRKTDALEALSTAWRAFPKGGYLRPLVSDSTVKSIHGFAIELKGRGGVILINGSSKMEQCILPSNWITEEIMVIYAPINTVVKSAKIVNSTLISLPPRAVVLLRGTLDVQEPL
jgi:hypothetical protein